MVSNLFSLELHAIQLMPLCRRTTNISVLKIKFVLMSINSLLWMVQELATDGLTYEVVGDRRNGKDLVKLSTPVLRQVLL